MSLINQVLLDLEKRHASESELKPLPAYVRAVPGPTRSGLWTIVLALMGTLTIVAVAVLLFMYRSDFAPLSATPQSVPASIKPAAPNLAPAALPAAAQAPAEEAPAQTVAFTPVSRLSDQLSLVPLPPIRIESPAAIVPPPNLRTENGSAKPEAASPKPKPPREAQRTRAAPAPGPARADSDSDKSEAAAPPASSSAQASKAETNGPQSILEVPEPGVGAPMNMEAQTRPDLTVGEASALPKPAPKADAPGAIDKQMREVVPAERAEIAFRRGVAQLQEGRASAAEIEFRSALTLDPTHGAAFQALLGLLLDTGRNGEAEQLLRKALDLNPRQPRYAMVLARLEIERGEISTAINTMVGVLPYVQSDPDFYAFLAALLQREGRHREAVDYYRTALRTVPGNGVWMMGLGISLRASNQVAEARDAFERALASKQLSTELQEFVARQLRELTAQKRK